MSGRLGDFLLAYAEYLDGKREYHDIPAWPCRCEKCAPRQDSCESCHVLAGEVCSPWCSEHPYSRAECQAMARAVGPGPAVEEHW